MFGFEFSDRINHHRFPSYDENLAVAPEDIDYMVPLVWQEHCVECAMPACYGTCARYEKRIDGRCKLFRYGIERVPNNMAILGQNVIIDMREWAKLETIFFTKVLPYKSVEKYNNLYCSIAQIVKTFRNGKIRRLGYYVKEYVSRKSGYSSQGRLPDYLLCEIINPGIAYTIILENMAAEQIVWRKSLRIENGYNRFLIPSFELSYKDGVQNNLLLYPEGNKEQVIYFISLALVTIKKEHINRYIKESDKKVKLVIWDLDNTIWDGTLSEDGIDKIKVKSNVVSIIKMLDSKGIINSIASKNDEDKVMKALDHFSLAEYFVAPMINWNPKSESIKAIARTLDIGMDTFVFVDDTDNELMEVKTNCPDVRVCNSINIDEYVLRDCFDVPITTESKNRRQSYKEISIRNANELKYKDDIVQFLVDCKMTMHIARPNETEYERCYELLQRTNQLNISGERLTREELGEILQINSYECYRIKVDDKYGNYGLVGFAIFDVSSKDVVILRHFVFSCRAARKRLEQAFFEHMICYYRTLGFEKLRIICRRTEKNALMQLVLRESGLFEEQDISEDSFELIASLKQKIVLSEIVMVVSD